MNRLEKKALELMKKAESSNTETLWEILSEEKADGFTFEEIYQLYMFLDKAWYGADHYWKGNDGEMKLITPNLKDYDEH